MTAPLNLHLNRYFDAAPEQVFDAWLTRDWGLWLPPAGAICEVVQIDPRPGGQYRVRMTMSDGRQVDIGGTYQVIDRPRRLSLTWLGSYSDHETVIELSFRAEGDGTMMTLRQTGFPDPAAREGFERGWSGPTGSFDKLEAHLRR